MSKEVVVKIQLLIMKMISHDSAVFIFFTSSPFILTNTLVAERLQKSHQKLDCMYSKGNEI